MLDPEAIATRQAEFASEGMGAFTERALTGMVIRLLGMKSGDFSEDGPGQAFAAIFAMISEQTGLTQEEIQSATADGITVAELLETNGGDLEAVRQALIEAFSAFPDGGDLDPDQMAAQWLGLQE
jgi:hypothetical protein